MSVTATGVQAVMSKQIVITTKTMSLRGRYFSARTNVLISWRLLPEGSQQYVSKLVIMARLWVVSVMAAV